LSFKQIETFKKINSKDRISIDFKYLCSIDFPFDTFNKSSEQKNTSIDLDLCSIDFPFETFKKSIEKKGIRGLMKKSTQEQVGHYRRPPQRTYNWRSGLLMGYPLEKLFGCCF